MPTSLAKLEIGNDADRQFLSVLRGEAWKGALSIHQFVRRNLALYSHPFGKTRVTTYLLRNRDKEIVTSMDTLLISLGDKERECPASLIASVFTPLQFRNQGLASQMISQFLESSSYQYSILFSDISMEFYEKLGYSGNPVSVLDKSSLSEKPEPNEPVLLGSFVKEIKIERTERLRQHSKNLTPLPDELFFDWQVERYRFFSRECKLNFPKDICWRLNHESKIHWLAAAPDFIHGTLDVLWRSSECEECISWARKMAKRFRLELVRYWAGGLVSESARREQPMIRISNSSSRPSLIDVQRCDWW